MIKFDCLKYDTDSEQVNLNDLISIYPHYTDNRNWDSWKEHFRSVNRNFTRKTGLTYEKFSMMIVRVIIKLFIRKMFDDLIYNKEEFKFPTKRGCGFSLKIAYKRNFKSKAYKYNILTEGRNYLLFFKQSKRLLRQIYDIYVCNINDNDYQKIQQMAIEGVKWEF